MFSSLYWVKKAKDTGEFKLSHTGVEKAKRKHREFVAVCGWHLGTIHKHDIGAFNREGRTTVIL
jgi:hypothetical protein